MTATMPSTSTTAGPAAPGRAVFPAVPLALPARERRGLDGLYAFARGLTDLARGAPGAGGPATVLSPAERLATLDDIAIDLGRWRAGGPVDQPLVRRLAAAAPAGRLPVEPLLRLVDGARAEARARRYPTFDALRGYCHLAADPVGELVLHLFGVAESAVVEPEWVELSDRICTGLKLIALLRDIGADARHDHVYLPGADRDRFGVPITALVADRAGAPLRDLIAFEAARAAAFLESGASLVSATHGWVRLVVSGYVARGRAALVALRRAGYDPLAHPVPVGRRGVVAEWLRATVRSAG